MNAEEMHSLKSMVDKISWQISDLSEKFEMMSGVVAQQASIIRTFEDERQRRIGSQSTVRVLYGLLTAGVAAMAYTMHDIILVFWPPKGH